MDTGGLSRPCFLLLVSVCVSVVSGSPVGTSTIDCTSFNERYVGAVTEEYTGDVEVVQGIQAGHNVQLVPFVFPDHLDFLELNFTLGDTVAIIRTKKPLDADVLTSSDRTLYYAIMCDGDIKYTNSRTLRVNDINDNHPKFDQELYEKTVSEATDVDREVLRVVAVDRDSSPANHLLTYSIEPPSDDFVVTNSGAFLLKKRLNYNVVQTYNFSLTAKDNGGLKDTVTVVINVEDYDDYNPYFSHSVYHAFIPENTKGSFRAIEPAAIRAQDGDTGINMSLVYSISSVSPAKYTENFDISRKSGELSLKTAIDREEMKDNVISVFIQAAQSDDISKTANSVVFVTVEDVNDNGPEFDQSDYSVQLLENSPADAVVLKAIVSDLDEGGFVGNLRILPESAPFYISADGTVRVKNSTALDRETTDIFTFQIEAKETNSPNHVAVAQVSVIILDENDNSPVFTSDKYKGSVTFANQEEGMLLVQVEAEDPDLGANGAIKYSIDFGNDDGYFSIEENTGEIKLAKTIPLVDDHFLNFLLYVSASDGGIKSRSSLAQVNIHVAGKSIPRFSQTVYKGTIEEEQDPGAVILKVGFLPKTAEIPVVLRVDTESDKFDISSSGELTTNVKFDCDEGPHKYSVNISISDSFNNSDYAVVEVEVTDINDNYPIFNSIPIASVPENAEVGTSVTVVVATDKDSGFNKEVRYWLSGGEGSFTVDPVSGLVSVTGALDRETKAEYNLQVVAEDQGCPARSSTASLLVKVSDVNDNVPEFSQAEYRVDPLETELVGAHLLTLSAVDPDEGVNGNVTYSIVQQRPRSDRPVFELDSSNGALRLAQPLDYSKVKMYRLIVQASDGGSPPLDGSCTVVVRVKDVNNNPPQFSRESYDVAIPENLASGVSILTLEVTDRDEDGFSNGYFLYTNDTFDINKQGVVSLRKDVALDRETIDNYVFEVVAVDQVTDGLRATAQLNITVLDYNDNTPQFPAILDPIRISENDYSERSPGKVVTIMPTDADLGPNGEVTLSLLPPDPHFKFTEDGTLLAVGSLDRERKETYDLVVKASDKGSPQRENITTIRVSLIDVNDNRPEFSSSSYFSTVMLKDAEPGKLLLTLSATDRDAGDNALVTYSFCEGSSQYLALDSKTGAVTLTSDFANVAEDTILQLTAMATDHGQPPLNSTARVVVELRAVRGVAFLSSFYNFSIPENKKEGTMVGKVTASSENNLYNVTYTLKTHTDQFSIGADGAIQTRTQLDKEEQDWYLLDVVAMDTRIPPTSATAVVMVQVEDVNEPPEFLNDEYEVSLHSIAPYKTPVVQVQALDPDVGHQSKLVYSLLSGRPYFDVEPSTGLVYVVSAVDLAPPHLETEVELVVKATDPKGLSAKTTVEVEIRGDASSSNVVVMVINRPAYALEKKVQPLEKSLGRVLKWDVGILEVSSVNGEDSRTPKASASFSFVCVNKKRAIPSETVIAKLENKSGEVQKALVRLFGKDLQYHVGANQELEDKDMSDKERSDVDGHDKGSTDESHDSETSEQGRMESPEKATGQVAEEREKKDGQ